MTDTQGARIERGARILRRAPVLATEVDGEVVMMDMEKGVYFGLDAIGTDIWRRLETPMTVGDLVDALSQTYAADAVTIERDVMALLRRMEEHELIEFG